MQLKIIDREMKTLTKKIVLFCILFACFTFVSANWKQCTKRKAHSTDIKVEVSSCDNPTRCPLYIGETHIITIYFTPNSTSDKTIERVIMARLQNVLSNGKSLEINYGTALNVTDRITRLSDNKKMSEIGQLESGVQYKYVDEFPVPKATTTSLTVRFVIREFVNGKSGRWESHRGVMYACVEIDVLVTNRNSNSTNSSQE